MTRRAKGKIHQRAPRASGGVRHQDIPRAAGLVPADHRCEPHRRARAWVKIALFAGTTSSFLCALVPRVLYAADAAEDAPTVPHQSVGAALAALLALCLLGAALLGFIWLTGRFVRRLTRGPVAKTKYDPLWFLKSLRPQQRNLNDPPTPPREELR